jgi:hypothetical protein
MVCGSSMGEDTELKALVTEALPKLHKHTKMAFEPAGEMAEFEKLCKIQEFAKQVMAETKCEPIAPARKAVKRRTCWRYP